MLAGSCPDSPNPFPDPDDPDTCEASSLTESSSYTNSGSTPSSSSSNPVGYLGGVPKVNASDLVGTGFDHSLVQSRSWSGLNNVGDNGNGWASRSDPYLVVYSTYDPQTGQNDNPMIAMVESGTSGMLFEVGHGSGSWESQFTSDAKIAFDTVTEEWTLTDAMGNRLVFADLPRDGAGELTTDTAVGYPGQGVFGKISQRIDAGGGVTTYFRDSGGNPISIARVDPVSGASDRLVQTYTTVTNSLGGSIDLLESVMLQNRESATSPYTPVRTVTYDYYDGTGVDAADGRLGDLKLATIREGAASGDIINRRYYRYSKQFGYARAADPGPAGNFATMGGTDTTYPAYTSAWNDPYFNIFQPADNTVWSGLKLVVEDASFDRMIAAFPNYETATDAELTEFADNHYTYERWSDSRWNYETYANADFSGGYHYYTRYRVVDEVSQGAGCSSCNDGQGTYKFQIHINPSSSGADNSEYDPNIWRMRVIESLPDDTPSDDADNDRNVVYVNEYGQVLLKAIVETDNIAMSMTGINRSSRTVTITSPGHGLASGDRVSIGGATASSASLPAGVPAGGKLPMYNGVHEITVTGPDTFTYQLSHVPDNTATPDIANMTLNSVSYWAADVFRYGQDGASGSDPVGNGQLVMHAFPSAVTGWDEAYRGLVTNSLTNSANNPYLADDTGRIEVFDYYNRTDATATNAGKVDGYLWRHKIKNGERDGGSLLVGGITLSRNQYFKREAGGATVYPLANEVFYRNENTSGEERTEFTYTFVPGTTQIESVTTRLPTVTSAQNGPNSADTVTVFLDTTGREIWRRDADGFLHYTAYDIDTGAVNKTITDVDDTQTTTFAGLPAGWSTPSGGGLHITTTMDIDPLGRTTRQVDPNGNVNYTVYNDAEHEVRSYQGWDATTGTSVTPIVISHQYRPVAGAPASESIVFNEQLILSVAPAVTGTVGSLVPTGTESFTATDIASMTRYLTNSGG